jgi:hypothetical protein
VSEVTMVNDELGDVCSVSSVEMLSGAVVQC